MAKIVMSKLGLSWLSCCLGSSWVKLWLGCFLGGVQGFYL
jgi:hypothetical protein